MKLKNKSASLESIVEDVSSEDSATEPSEPAAQPEQAELADLATLRVAFELLRVRPSSGLDFGVPTRAQQLSMFCGNNAHLMHYARKRYGDTPGGMPTRAIRAWYARNPTFLPAHLQGCRFGVRAEDIQVSHIIPVSHGGVDWPSNYCLCSARVNRHFGDSVSKEWIAYVGREAFNMAKITMRWFTSVSPVTFGRFDPVADGRLVRGRR